MIWGIALITLLVVSYASAARLRLQMAFNLAKASQADLIADAAIGRGALSLLSESQQNHTAPPLSDATGRQEERVVHDGKPKFCFLNESAVAISIEDENGKVDLNAAPQKLLRTLLAGLGLPARDADAAAAGVVAFRSADASSDAQQLDTSEKPFGLKRAPFQTIAELDQVPGVSPLLFKSLSSLVTVHSRNPGVDPKTAPPALFALLLGQPPEEIHSLLAKPFPNAIDRTDPRFPREFQGPGLGRVFLVHVEVVLATGQTSVREALLDLRGASGEAFAIRELRRANARYLPALRAAARDLHSALSECV
ncbi:MAG: type II secretion system protein GspK [Methylocystis sp.]